jgi:16S rRNA (guanine527-N7)-methyltransferase
VDAASKTDSPYGNIGVWFPELESATIDQLLLYRDELLRFNKSISLISISTIDKIDQVHLSDSILGWRIIRKKITSNRVHDLGSGNGFPGIVAGVLSPEVSVVLVESDTRKAEFLKHIAALLKLSNVSVACRRAESLAPDRIVFGMSRGFASIQKTLLAIRKSMSPKGQLFHFKGPEWSTEVAALPQQLCSTWNTSHVEDYNLPETSIVHSIIKSTLN